MIGEFVFMSIACFLKDLVFSEVNVKALADIVDIACGKKCLVV